MGRAAEWAQPALFGGLTQAWARQGLTRPRLRRTRKPPSGGFLVVSGRCEEHVGRVEVGAGSTYTVSIPPWPTPCPRPAKSSSGSLTTFFIQSTSTERKLLTEEWRTDLVAKLKRAVPHAPQALGVGTTAGLASGRQCQPFNQSFNKKLTQSDRRVGILELSSNQLKALLDHG